MRGAGPEVGGGGAEEGFVAGEGLGVLVAEASSLFVFARAGVVVEFATEGVSTEVVPIVAGEDEVGVADLIDGLGGGAGVARFYAEEEEAAVLLDGSAGEIEGPVLFFD